MNSNLSNIWLRAVRSLGEVSVILPAYNVGYIIRKVIESVARVLEASDLRDYEIIVVNDGSKDNTIEESLKAKLGLNGRLKIISYNRNRGKGFAVMVGVANATKPYVVMLDADGDIDPKQLIYVLAPLVKYDVVITSKWHPQSNTQASRLRKFLSHGFRALVWALLGIKARDTQTGAKAFRASLIKKVVGRLRIRRYAFDVELLANLKSLGARIIEVPSIHKLVLSKPPRPSTVFTMLLELLATKYRLLFSSHEDADP